MTNELYTVEGSEAETPIYDHGDNWHIINESEMDLQVLRAPKDNRIRELIKEGSLDCWI